MAKTYSITELKWIAHVGIDKALSGSLCVTNGKDSTTSDGKFPRPYKNAEWPSKPSDGPVAIKKKNTAAIPSAILRPKFMEGGFGFVMASLKPKT